MFEMVVCTLCVTKEMSTTFPVTLRLNSAHIYETIFRTPHHTQFIILSLLFLCQKRIEFCRLALSKGKARTL